jgi:hypothetical protein
MAEPSRLRRLSRLPGRSRYAERFPPHIDGGPFAPLVHRSSGDTGAQYALTDAWDSSEGAASAGCPVAFAKRPGAVTRPMT